MSQISAEPGAGVCKACSELWAHILLGKMGTSGCKWGENFKSRRSDQSEAKWQVWVKQGQWRQERPAAMSGEHPEIKGREVLTGQPCGEPTTAESEKTYAAEGTELEDDASQEAGLGPVGSHGHAEHRGPHLVGNVEPFKA